MRGFLRATAIVVCVVCLATPVALGQSGASARAGEWSTGCSSTWSAELASWWNEVWTEVSAWSLGASEVTHQTEASTSSPVDPSSTQAYDLGTVTADRGAAADPNG